MSRRRRSPWSINPETVAEYRAQREETLNRAACGDEQNGRWYLIRAAIALAEEASRADEARRGRRYRVVRVKEAA